MQNCVSDVKKWTIHNKLQLNENKTEALLFDPSKSSTFLMFLESVRVMYFFAIVPVISVLCLTVGSP